MILQEEQPHFANNLTSKLGFESLPAPVKKSKPCFGFESNSSGPSHLFLSLTFQKDSFNTLSESNGGSDGI